MPQKPTFKLAPLNLGQESLGQRLARLRKARGYTQTDLARKLSQARSSERQIHNIRVLISDYERNIIRPNYEMIARLALALGVTADELLGIKPAQNQTHQPKLKIQKRINAIEKLPTSQQKALLKTIDAFLKAAQL
jgi:transcriptional regulator with XRE-family HTH domain